MSAIDIKLTKKQGLCLQRLQDNFTNEVLYGGSAGSGKSFIGCFWITDLCLRYPGVRCLIGRTVLSQLRLTTLNTLFETFATMKMLPEKHYKYNGQSNIITFYNGSEIILKDLAYQPSDPNFDSLGGLELTAVFIDEAAQVTQLAYNILKSRIRFKLKEHNLIPKLLMSCNPGQVWLKKVFYIPAIQGTLEPNKVFIPALPTDNRHLPESYIEMLKTLPQAQRRRLLEGDWNYMDEDDNLFNFDSISNSQFLLTPNPNNKKYMTVDVARFGADRSVVMIWVGLVLVEHHIYEKLDTVQLSEEIKELIDKHNIPLSQVIVDSDGVGGGVADMIKGVNFVNNSSALYNQNFANLKSQCFVKLSEMFKEGKISLNILDPSIMDQLTQELLAVKLKNMDKDNKVAVQSKEEMKRQLGVSPDLADCLMFRMWFELKNLKSTGRYALIFV